MFLCVTFFDGRLDATGDAPDARAMLREQLEQLREQENSNPQLQEMLDGMLRQINDAE